MESRIEQLDGRRERELEKQLEGLKELNYHLQREAKKAAIAQEVLTKQLSETMRELEGQRGQRGREGQVGEKYKAALQEVKALRKEVYSLRTVRRREARDMGDKSFLTMGPSEGEAGCC